MKVEQAEATGETHEVGADQMFFSVTDECGIIDHSNKIFVELSRYGRDELIGAPHNVIRYPAMPRGVFHAVWATIKAGQPFAAYVRDLTSDGSEYGVFATVTPLEDGGHLSVRMRPGCEGLSGVALLIYEEATAFEEKLESDGLARRQVASEGAAKILELLDEAGMPSYKGFQNIALPAEVVKRESVADEFPKRPKASGALTQMLSDAKGIAKEPDVWMNWQDDLVDPSAMLRSTRDDLCKEVDDDALPAALGQSEPTTKKLTQLLETWRQMKDLVREPTDQLVDALARLDKVSARTRFRVALARLHTTVMTKFTAELIDGGVDADASADAIAMLGGALRKGLSEMEEMTAVHADLASQTANFTVETSNLLAISRQVLMLQNQGQGSDSEGASDGPDTLADAVSRRIDAVGESLKEFNGLARRCRGFDIAIGSSTLRTLLDDVEQRLLTLARPKRPAIEALAAENHPNGLHSKTNVISLLAMTTSNISVPGGAICIKAAGEGPLVVCSPAMGDGRDASALFSRRLVEVGFRVASADLRDHGDSSAGSDSYDDEPTAQDMLAVVDELGGGPAILAGASMSAAAAAIAAGKEPEKVSGPTLFGSFLRDVSNPLTRPGLHLALIRPWGPTIQYLCSCRLRSGFGDQASARASRLSSIPKRKGHWAAFSKTARMDHIVVAPWFNRVTAPTLVIMGAEDPDWKDPRAEVSWAASQFTQGAFAMVEGVGHAPMLESPNVTAREAIAFASRIGFGGAHA